jgi:hypothetical protein
MFYRIFKNLPFICQAASGPLSHLLKPFWPINLVTLWWVRVHWASLEMLRSMEQESLNIEQFCQRKFNKIKTNYFGETGAWSWYYWKELYGGISKVKEGKRNNKNSFIFGRGDSVIHINYSSWCAHNSFFFFFFWKEPYSLAHQQKHLSIERSPNVGNPFGPRLQNRNKCIPKQFTFSVYIHESWTLGKPYGIKLRCYWECLREQLGNLRNLEGTQWEHVENTLEQRRKNKKITPHTWPHPQKEKQGPSRVHAEPSHWLHEISI